MLAYLVAGDRNMSVPSDPVALMEFYAKKAAQEERKRPLRQSKDEMPPPPSLQGTFSVTLFVVLENC
jgi:splicing factor 4